MIYFKLPYYYFYHFIVLDDIDSLLISATINDEQQSKSRNVFIYISSNAT